MEYNCPFCSNIIDINTIQQEHQTYGRIHCKKCGRLLKICYPCKSANGQKNLTLNKSIARYCQYCGDSFFKEKNSEIGNSLNWVQEGRDVLRSSFSPSEISLESELVEKSRYPRQKDDFLFLGKKYTVDPSTISLPGMIIAEDLLVYYNQEKHCFIALSIDTKELEFQWKCSFEDYKIDKNATPVAYNGFLYVISTEPKLIHKISLDNGNREILSFYAMNEESGKQYFELEGRNFKDFSPLLIGHPNKLCPNPCLFYITKENTWVINLSEESYNAKNSSIRGWHYKHKPVIEDEISRPVFVEDYLLSTLLTDSHSGIQYFDLSAFPWKLETRKILPRDYENARSDEFKDFINTDKWKYTPCVASKENGKFIITWFAFSRDLHSFATVKFKGLNKINVLNHSKNDEKYDERVFDNASRLIPIRIGGQDYISISDQGSYYIFKDFLEKTGKRICKEVTPYRFEFAIPVSPQGIFVPFEDNSFVIINTGSENSEKPKITRDTIINKPVKRLNRIYLQTNAGIECIAIGNDNN